LMNFAQYYKVDILHCPTWQFFQPTGPVVQIPEEMGEMQMKFLSL